MAIYKTDDGTYCISSSGSWLCGAFESRAVARWAYQFTDVERHDLQARANVRSGGKGGVVTRADLRSLRNNTRDTTKMKTRGFT